MDSNTSNTMLRLGLLSAAMVAYVLLLTFAVPRISDAHTNGHTCTAQNHCTPTVTLFSATSDQFYNYDHKNSSDHNDNVDWPLTLLFYNNAEIDHVKDTLMAYNPALIRQGSGKRLRLMEAGEYQNGSTVPPLYEVFGWDSDSGIKDLAAGCTYAQARHMRVYADSAFIQYSYDKLYNDGFGFYILATTHVDYNDGCAGRWHGFSENAEDWFEYYSNNVPGWTTYSDWGGFANNETWRVDGGNIPHYWLNGGTGTYVRVS